MPGMVDASRSRRSTSSGRRLHDSKAYPELGASSVCTPSGDTPYLPHWRPRVDEPRCSNGASTLDLVVRTHAHREHASDRITAVVPTVASAVQYHDIARSEGDLDAVIQLEADDALQHYVVVVSRRAMHPRIVRVGPGGQTISHELVEVVSVGGQLHQGSPAPTRRRKRLRESWLASIIRKPTRLVATPKGSNRRPLVTDHHRRYGAVTDKDRYPIRIMSGHHTSNCHHETLPERCRTVLHLGDSCSARTATRRSL